MAGRSSARGYWRPVHGGDRGDGKPPGIASMVGLLAASAEMYFSVVIATFIVVL